RFVNLCVSSLVLGICSIYYIFVVDHTREPHNDPLKASVEADQCKTTRDIAEDLDVHHTTVVRHMKSERRSTTSSKTGKFNENRVVTHIWPQVHLSKLSYLFIAILPFMLLSCVRSIRLMSYVSIAGNICMLLSVVIIFSQLLSAKHVYEELPWFTDVRGVILASGAVIYSFEGQTLVLPLENKMKHPCEMRGWTGVLSTGISLVL
ncbi:unnamed protein product, partial [Heligmosomoides polygyrus]